jgi:hypothetical protein
MLYLQNTQTLIFEKMQGHGDVNQGLEGMQEDTVRYALLMLEYVKLRL